MDIPMSIQHVLYAMSLGHMDIRSFLISRSVLTAISRQEFFRQSGRASSLC